MNNAVRKNYRGMPCDTIGGRGPLVVQNEGSRSLKIIGDMIPDECQIAPGGSCELDLSIAARPIYLTLWDGGLQVGHVESSEGPAAIVGYSPEHSRPA